MPSSIVMEYCIEGLYIKVAALFLSFFQLLSLSLIASTTPMWTFFIDGWIGKAKDEDCKGWWMWLGQYD